MEYPAAFAAAGVQGEGSVTPRQYRSPAPRKKRQQAGPEGRVWDMPSDIWMEKAAKLVEYAHQQLLKNPAELAYLAGRGLNLERVKKYKLGWLPGENGKNAMFRARSSWDLPEVIKKETGRPKVLWLPRGIVIPLIDDDGRVLRVRIRRPKYDMRSEDDIKYYVVPGSSQKTMIINPDSDALIPIEAELDTILVAEECAGLAGAIATMSDTGKPDAYAVEKLQKAKAIPVALDFDERKPDGTRPGGDAAQWWLKNFSRAYRWPVPEGKDPGDAFKKGISIREWILVGLPPVFRVREKARLEANGIQQSQSPAVKPEPKPQPDPVKPAQKQITPLGEMFAFLDDHPEMFLKFFSAKVGAAEYAPAPADNLLVCDLTDLMVAAVDEIEKDPVSVAVRYGKPRTEFN